MNNQVKKTIENIIWFVKLIRPKKNYWKLAVPIGLIIIGEIIKKENSLIFFIEGYVESLEPSTTKSILNAILAYCNIELSWLAIGLLIILFAIITYVKVIESSSQSDLVEKGLQTANQGIDELKKMYQKNLEKTSLEKAQQLSTEYPYGYILFGIIKGEFFFPAIETDSTMEITADWDKTTLENNDNDSYLLTIKNLRQNGTFGNNNTLNLTIGSYNITLPRNPKQKEILLGTVMISDQPNIYFKIIDNSEPESPVYLIGFKKG